MGSTTKAATNGGTTVKAKDTAREHGLSVLREIEAKALISLASDALSQTSHVGHEMHGLIYDRDRKASLDQLRTLLEEALICWQTADHYLRMLDSVLEERDYALDPQSIEPAF
ncbi:MAG: hypothetical protein J2P27_04260 [Actinobacteria bacterium]|nr:hypothetical protein [Actinomycetota bacterium]